MSKKAIVIIIVIVFVIAIGVSGYFLLKKMKEGKAEIAEIDEIPAPAEPPPVGAKWVQEKFPVGKGMFGGMIKNVQVKLGLTADGKFGSGTEAAVVKKWGKKTFDKADYDALVNAEAIAAAKAAAAKAAAEAAAKAEAASSGGKNYEAVKVATGYETTDSQGKVNSIWTVIGENDKYQFHFYKDGSWSLTKAGGKTALMGGTYSGGADKMVITKGGSGTFVQGLKANARTIVNKFYAYSSFSEDKFIFSNN
jgi:hypothetical protein